MEHTKSVKNTKQKRMRQSM